MAILHLRTAVVLLFPFITCNHAYSPMSRKQILVDGAVAASAWTTLPFTCRAASPTSTSEAIRRSAANLPGYGQTDVFYPISFDGKWKVKRDIVASDIMDPAKLPLTLSYEMRFLRSIEDDAVVADRGFNEVALENSLNHEVLSYEWSESNPNDLRLVFVDGTRKEIKVTKRATERTEDTVSCSEFQRLTTENARGIPIISAHRLLSKWKVVSDASIEGIEIVYDVGGTLGDPLAATAAPSKPRLISKSRLSLQRIT